LLKAGSALLNHSIQTFVYVRPKKCCD